MKIEVPNGDIFDKYSILCIKSSKITDPVKLNGIHLELESLRASYHFVLALIDSSLAYDAALVAFSKLQEINEALWIIEDRIRVKEADKCYDEEFIQLARSVYITNDERCALKRDINIITDSKFQEEKAYTKY